MCNYSFFIGADISKSVIDISYRYKGKVIYLGQFANNQKGFKRVVGKLMKISDIDTEPWFVCFENTGVYSKPFLEFLIIQSIPSKEESALKISRSLGLRRGKDDKVDSMDICQYAYEKKDSLIDILTV